MWPKQLPTQLWDFVLNVYPRVVMKIDLVVVVVMIMVVLELAVFAPLYLIPSISVLLYFSFISATAYLDAPDNALVLVLKVVLAMLACSEMQVHIGI